MSDKDTTIHVVDPDYLVALYLQKQSTAVTEQKLIRDVIAIVETLWEMGLEVEVSSQESLSGDLVSPEISSALMHLRQSGLVKAYGGGHARMTFKFEKQNNAKDPRATILPSHREYLGSEIDDKIKAVVGIANRKLLRVCRGVWQAENPRYKKGAKFLPCPMVYPGKEK